MRGIYIYQLQSVRQGHLLVLINPTSHTLGSKIVYCSISEIVSFHITTASFPTLQLYTFIIIHQHTECTYVMGCIGACIKGHCTRHHVETTPPIYTNQLPHKEMTFSNSACSGLQAHYVNNVGALVHVQ